VGWEEVVEEAGGGDSPFSSPPSFLSHLSFSIVSPLAHFFTLFSNEWYTSRMDGVWRLLSFTLSVIQFNHNLKVQLYLLTLFVSKLYPIIYPTQMYT
jgi:hypothetical protein